MPFMFTEHVVSQVSHPEMSCTAGRHSQTDGQISFAMRCIGMERSFPVCPPYLDSVLPRIEIGHGAA